MTTEYTEYEATKFFKFLAWVNVLVLLIPFIAISLASGNPLTGSISITLAIIFLPFAMLGLFLVPYNLIVIPMKLKTMPFNKVEVNVLKLIWSLTIAAVTAGLLLGIKAIL